MQLVVAGGVRVLHRDLGAELDVLAHRLAERRSGGMPAVVERGHVQLDEAPALRLIDVQPAVDVDQVPESELARETVGAAEALRREHRQVLDVLRPALTEQRLKQRVGEHAVVEDLLEPVQRRLAAGVLVEGLWGREPCAHVTGSNSPGTRPASPGRRRQSPVEARYQRGSRSCAAVRRSSPCRPP